MARAGWAVTLLAVVALLVVALDAGDDGVPELWSVELRDPAGVDVVARATCYETLPRHVSLTLTRSGRSMLATDGIWLAEKATVMQLVCMTGELNGALSWAVPSLEGIEGELTPTGAR